MNNNTVENNKINIYDPKYNKVRNILKMKVFHQTNNVVYLSPGKASSDMLSLIVDNHMIINKNKSHPYFFRFVKFPEIINKHYQIGVKLMYGWVHGGKEEITFRFFKQKYVPKWIIMIHYVRVFISHIRYI